MKSPENFEKCLNEKGIARNYQWKTLRKAKENAK